MHGSSTAEHEYGAKRHGSPYRDSMGKLTEHIHTEHENLRPHIESVRIAADAVGEVPPEILRELTDSVLGFLLRELIPHAHREEEVLYTAVEQVMGAPGATTTMTLDHVEISRLVDELGTIHAMLVAEHSLEESTERDLRRVLYGVYALARLHFAKEEEVYSRLLDMRLTPEDEERLLREMSTE